MLRRLYRGFGAVVVIGMVWASTADRAAALPAPREPDELERWSDLVVEGDVLSVTKLGGPAGPVWRARLRVLKTLKGRPPAAVMTYDFVPPTSGLAGELNSSVFAGERLRMYLVFERGEYVIWASNGIDRLGKPAESRRIPPAQQGECFDALPKRAHTRGRRHTACPVVRGVGFFARKRWAVLAPNRHR